MPIYAREGVGHLWLVDPIARTVEVYRLDGGRWVVEPPRQATRRRASRRSRRSRSTRDGGGGGGERGARAPEHVYSTVTLFARFRG